MRSMKSRDVIAFFRRNKRLLMLPFILFFGYLFISTIHDSINYSKRYSSSASSYYGDQSDGSRIHVPLARYTYQQAYLKYNEKSTVYDIGIIADKDKSSKKDRSWTSTFKRGTLVRNSNGMYSIQWVSDTELKSGLNEDGRAMELSELVQFNNKLLSFDDRTGIVFELVDSTAIPQHILMNGDGRTNKGFKTEWATVKDDLLYVGSTGKEWTVNGKVVNNHPMWVKTIDREGRIKHHDWSSVYESLRFITRTEYPGYLLHEAVNFNAIDRRWYFFPRRVSHEAYDEVADETRGSNVVISCDEYMKDMRTFKLGTLNKTRGFSSFKFVPWRENELVALKTEESSSRVATYITVLDLDGKILMEEQEIENVKFEGVEFL